MRILLTGAAGFIGARTALLLLEQGHHVWGVDNLNAVYDVRLKSYRINQILHSNFSFFPIDIEQRGALEELFRQVRFDAVVNLAARAGVRASVQDPEVFFTTNVMGNLNLLELTRQFRVPKFVLASTSALYAGQPTPFVESLPVNEPISPYAASKKAAEIMCYPYHRLFGTDVSILRFFTVYGPAGRPDMAVFRFIRWIDEGRPIQVWGDGRQSRDFTYVDDIAAGVSAALQRVGFEIINLGGGQQPTTVLEVIRMLERSLDRSARIEFEAPHPADLPETQADISKARRLLNWRPQVDLCQGLQRCVDWYRQEKTWVQEIEL